MVRKGWVKLDRDLAIVSAVPAEVRGEVESRVAKFRTLYRKAIAEALGPQDPRDRSREMAAATSIQVTVPKRCTASCGLPRGQSMRRR